MNRLLNKVRKKRKDPKPTGPSFHVVIDSPASTMLDNRTVNLEGWVVSLENKTIKNLRFWDGVGYQEIDKRVKRTDVSAHFRELSEDVSLNSGFSHEFIYQKGNVWLEADFGDGFIKIKSFDFALYKSVAEANFNPRLAQNWADHVDLMDAKQKYFHEEEGRGIGARKDASPKVVALYLPQFYPIPENDKAWGKGFTEWSNVTTAKPRFVGHRQPILPADLGYYDLRLEDTMERQVNLAKKNGIYGFCLYYYWFSGKKVLDLPINTLLKNKHWDFRFMLCWANHNWTKRWDGRDNEIILEQKYAQEDPLNFIKDVEHILLDERYIRINGKAALMVYHPKLIDAKKYTKIWRDYFRKKHNQELHLITVWATETANPIKLGFDAAMEFIPGAIGYRQNFSDYRVEEHVIDDKLIDTRQTSSVVDYRKLSKQLSREVSESKSNNYPLYRCVITSWDNDARKKGKNSTIYSYENPDMYYRWLNQVTKSAKQNEGITFVNAWNEWAEGAILEPSLHYGHALLNRTSDVIAQRRPDFYPKMKKKATKTAIIVQIEDVNEFQKSSKYLKNISSSMLDVFVAMDANNRIWESKVKKILPDCQILFFPNRGRNLLPFLHILSRVEMLGYKSVGRFVFSAEQEFSPNLISSTKIIKHLESLTKDGPVFVCSAISEDKGANISIQAQDLFLELNAEKDAPKTIYNFSIENFWSNIEPLLPICRYGFMADDFPAEIIESAHKKEAVIEECISLSLSLNTVVRYTVKGKSIKRLYENGR